MSNTICPLPWLHLSAQADTAMRLCCNTDNGGSITKDGNKVYLSEITNPLEYFNLPIYKDIRQKMIAGEKPNICSKCYATEDAGGVSMRSAFTWQFKNVDFLSNTNTETGELLKADVKYIDFAWGNKCNLQCKMCGPGLSNQLIKEFSELLFISKDSVKKHTSINDSWEFDKLQLVVESMISDTTNILVTGGEPLINPEFERFCLYLIDKGLSKNIHLSFHTNLNTSLDKWIDLFKEFKFIDLHASIDGVGKDYEYIRYPGKWSKIENNLNLLHADTRLENLQVEIHTVFSSFNVHAIPDMLEYFSKFNKPNFFNFPFFIYVDGPEYACPAILPYSDKKEIAKNIENAIIKYRDRYENQENVNSKIAQLNSNITFMLNNQLDTEKFNAFVEKQDQYRNTKTTDYIPWYSKKQEIVTITCSRDFEEMKRQSRSINLFVKEKCTHYVVIEDSDISIDTWQSSLQPFYTKHKLILLTTYDFGIDFEELRNIAAGWVIQQLLKLYIVSKITTEQYLILDSKNFFIKNVSLNEWPVIEGNGMTNEINTENKWYDFIKYMSDSLNKPVPSSFSLAHTPFVFRTSVVKEIVNTCDLTDMFFKFNKGYEKISEFNLYCLFSPEPVNVTAFYKTFWPDKAFPTTEEILEIHTDPAILMLAFHRGLSDQNLLEFRELTQFIEDTVFKPVIMQREIVDKFKNKSEPLIDLYISHSDKIKNILTEYSELEIEGNCFSMHNTYPNNYPCSEFQSHRLNLIMFALTRQSILAIGFNAGHSTLLGLTANQTLQYTAVDINHHPYTIRCFEYLKGIFRDRLTMEIGDSVTVLPHLLKNNNSFDGYIIDGGHDFKVIMSDLTNVLRFAKSGSMLLVDDTQHPPIKFAINYFMVKGSITRISDESGYISTKTSEIFRIN